MRQRFVSFFIQILLIVTFVFSGGYVAAQKNVPIDSLRTPGDTVKNAAKNPVATKDSIQSIRLKELEKNSDIKTSITYSADDYMLLDIDNKTLYLHKAGSLKYDEMVLKADSVAVDWNANTMYANGLVDSTGQLLGQPGFTENDQTYSAQRIAYNFKSQKGLVTMARTKQGSEYILGDKVKKVDENTYYIKNGKFTSCELDHPHYYIKSTKLKVIPREKIITGPLMLVVEDFPLPVILPFGFFPNQTGQRSGLLMPTYGESADRGFFLRNGGYYWSISDYWDLALTGDIFSKGGYRLDVKTAYNKRYRYSGKFGFEYGLQKFGQKDDPIEYQKRTTNFHLTWNHRQTINPQTKFNADVNLLSSGFFQANSYNEKDYLTNTIKSTVTLNKSFPNSPWSVNANLNHSMNTGTKMMTIDLPNVAVVRPRFFPLKGKNATGNKWYHSIGMNYSGSMINTLTAPDSIMVDILRNPTGNITYIEIEDSDTTEITKRALDYFRNGIRQSLPISSQFTLARYVNLSPSINYNEYWFLRTTDFSFNPDSNRVESTDKYGFAAARDFDFNLNTSTRVYGVFQTKSKRQTAFRHTVQPAMGFTYKPDFSDPFWGFYQEMRLDTANDKTQRRSRFQNNAYSGPSAGERQSVNFSLNNILEMKFRSKEAMKDSTIKDPWTRMSIFDQLSASTDYNFALDSMKLSNINLSARTNFLNNKFTLLWTGLLDPYAVDTNGERIATFLAQNGDGLARLSNSRLSLNTSISSKKSGGVQVGPTKKRVPEPLADMQVYRDLYADFDVSWRINMGIVMTYSNNGVVRDTSLNLNVSGDFNLTPKWKLGYTTGYDFDKNDFSYTSLTLYRDLHCWEMSMTLIPFGQRKSYNFVLNVKSSTLKDLKIPKQRNWQDQFRPNTF